jgi:hypothetical protein
MPNTYFQRLPIEDSIKQSHQVQTDVKFVLLIMRSIFQKTQIIIIGIYFLLQIIKLKLKDYSELLMQVPRDMQDKIVRMTTFQNLRI